MDAKHVDVCQVQVQAQQVSSVSYENNPYLTVLLIIDFPPVILAVLDICIRVLLHMLNGALIFACHRFIVIVFTSRTDENDVCHPRCAASPMVDSGLSLPTAYCCLLLLCNTVHFNHLLEAVVVQAEWGNIGALRINMYGENIALYIVQAALQQVTR